MQKLVFFLVLFLLMNCSSNTNQQQENLSKLTSQTNCEWCGAHEAPKDLSWQTTIPPKEEKGDPLIISGTVYQADGKTPAEDVLIYVYHTNIEGVYPKRGDETGNDRRHGYLRGWMKTNAEGKYEFKTIIPAPYETHGGEPAHIHYTVQAPGQAEYWLTGLWFTHDPRVTPELVAKVPRDGGFSNVTELTVFDNGIYKGTRDILLQQFEE